MKIDKTTRQNEMREEMRGGDGEIKIAHILKDDTLPQNLRLFGEITVDTGCSIGSHTHENEAEIFYILEGNVVINDNGENKEFCAGDTCVTCGGAMHGVKNIGERPAKILAFIVMA